MLYQKNIILYIACSAVFLEALDLAIMNLALPLIQKHFQLETEQSQWLQTIYVLLYGGLLIIGGKLADLWGRKKIFLTGAFLFLITSFGAGMSTSFTSLFIFRAIQGLAAAFLMPSAMAIITNTFKTGQERAKALGIFSAFAAIGSGCGLSLGGIIASTLGWQWIFFINIPIISCSMILAFLIIQPDQQTTVRPHSDLISGILLSICILFLSYLIHSIPILIQKPILASFLLSGFVLGFVYFIKRTRAHPTPLIDFQLLKGRYTQIGNKTIFILGSFFLSYLLLLSFYLQEILSFSAARAGLFLFPFSIASALVSKYLLPKLFNYLKIIKTAILGMSLMFFGALFLFFGMWYEQFVLVILSVACVIGMGMAISIPSLTVMALQQIPAAHQGVASGVNTTAYFFGSGLGLSLVSLIMQLDELFATTYSQLMAAVMMLLLFTAIGIGYLTRNLNRAMVEQSS